MQTQSHVLLALALLTKRDAPKRNFVVFLGALIPDAFIYFAWAYYTLSGNSQTHIWDVLYFQNPTQFWDALFNSIPFFSAIALCGLVLLRSNTYKRFGLLITLFGLAALIHIATDFPVHASDAHRHFWPLSDWRFYSPLSYWERDHHSVLVTLAEALLGLGVTGVLWRRFTGRKTRVLLALVLIFYTILLAGSLLFMTGIMGANA